MKKLFTSSLLLVGALLTAPLRSLAADLVVAQNGAGGAYATLTAAVTAAADGDRILVKASASPFAEALTITKSLTFLCNDEGQRFTASGDWTFNPTGAARTLTIIGLDLVSGSITTAGTAATTGRSRVRVFNTILRNGLLNFNANNFELTAAADSIIGGVKMRYGRLMGNYVNNTAGANGFNAIEISNDAAPTEDSVWVVGNKVVSYPDYRGVGVYLNTSSQYAYCANNFCYSTERPIGIQLINGKSGSGVNTIINNTLQSAQYFYFGSIYLSAPVANLLVANNLSVSQSSNYSIVQSGGSSNYSLVYNISRNGIFSVQVPLGSTNSAASNTTLDATGAPVAGSDAINGGDPDAAFTDLNLTRNDAGAYGGSFSLANFHPFTNGGGRARVYQMQAPRRILQGGSVGVKATGFDR